MKKVIIVLLIFFGFLVQTSFATDGYYRNGYGVKYSALAGAGVAVSLSSLGAITNPASIVNIKTSIEFDAAWFSPVRDYTITGNPSMFDGTFGLVPGKVESNSTSFFFPTFGGNMKLADNMALGFSIFANGGMNTDYPTNTFYDPFAPSTGVNLEQIFANATFAIELAKQQAFGVSAIFGFQRFAATGLYSFGGFSSDFDPLTGRNLTGNQWSTATGFGFKIGYQGQLTEWLRLGAAYQSPIWMSKFEKYAGLFAEQGGFNVPASWQAGIAVMPNQNWTFLLDARQILYSSIKSINNPLLPNLQTSLLGKDDGAGFGWKDVLAVKFGAMFTEVEGWDFMAGYSFNQNPIPESEVLFNILAPAVIQHHISAGFTKHFTEQQELTVSFMYALENSVTGPNPLEIPGQQEIKITMKQVQIEVGYIFSSL